MRWPVLLLALLLVVIVLVWLTGRGGQPRYRSYRVEIELLVRGSPVSLAGEVVCTRERSGINTGWQTTYGLAQPSTLATRLESGEILVVKPPSFCVSGVPEDATAHVPSVFLFEGGDPPRAIHAYVDPVHLGDPEADVQVRRVAYTALGGSAFPSFGAGHRPTSAGDLIPWVNAPGYQRASGPQWFYRGYLIDAICFSNPGAAAALARVERRESGLTRIDYDSDYDRETLREMEADAAGRLGMDVDWADPAGRCRRNPDDPLCRVLTRQRPLRFEIAADRHVIEIPPDPPRGPLRMLPVTGGPPPIYSNKIGHSGDEEISDKVPATLLVGEERLEMPHDFISTYSLAVTVDWTNERIFRVFLVEIDPSVF